MNIDIEKEKLKNKFKMVYSDDPFTKYSLYGIFEKHIKNGFTIDNFEFHFNSLNYKILFEVYDNEEYCIETYSGHIHALEYDFNSEEDFFIYRDYIYNYIKRNILIDEILE